MIENKINETISSVIELTKVAAIQHDGFKFELGYRK